MFDEYVSSLTSAQFETALVGALNLNGATSPQQALAALGAGVRPNLLDNSYFVGGGSQQGGGQFPINQRGKTSYIGSGYGIDRWKWDRSDELASMIIHDGYTTFQRNGWLRQIVESGRTTFDGKTMTASILTNEGELQTVTFVATADDSYVNTERWMFNHYFNGHAWIFGFCAFNRDCNALAAKLELGSQQTLAHQDENGNWVLNEIPNFQQELAKCQRYFQLYSAAGTRPAKAVDCRPVMRTDPVQSTTVIGETTYYCNNAEL